LNYEKIKEQLLSRVDEIAKVIKSGKTVEIKKGTNENIQILEVTKRKVTD